ncbi:MAG TPA: MinD/ParA family protein [Phycisphaerae bacterium]|nr:MinD/ParA family protein [Phycisphaerae bacterium]
MLETRGQFRMRDQAARLRELVAGHKPSAPGGVLVAVTSGKGGVGKTNLAVNLAICLAARGSRVGLVDLDLGLANADLLLDARCAYNLSHVISGLRSIDQVGATTAGEVFFVPGVSGVDHLANLSDFERRHLIGQMRRLAASRDVVILDCGAGISANVLSFALASDVCLLVTSPEPTAVTDAYALIKVMKQKNHPGAIRLVVNLAETSSEASEVHQRITSVVERFLKTPIADGGYMLHDTHVELAVRQRCPFLLRYPRCAASACLTAIADRLTEGKTPLRRTRGLFRRVVGLFL